MVSRLGGVSATSNQRMLTEGVWMVVRKISDDKAKLEEQRRCVRCWDRLLYGLPNRLTVMKPLPNMRTSIHRRPWRTRSGVVARVGSVWAPVGTSMWYAFTHGRCNTVSPHRNLSHR